MLVRIPTANLPELAARRGEAYVEALRTAGRVAGDFIWIKNTTANDLMAAHPTVGAPQIPGEKTPILTKLTRLRRELAAWLKAGAPLASREVRRERLAICKSCSFYRSTGNWGLGECQAPGCGCTRAKLALATSRCPLKPPKW